MSEPDPKRWIALAIVCAAFFMTVLDVSIVNVALPSIGKSLHFSRDNLQWVVTAYAITFGGFLLARRPRGVTCSAGAACSSWAWSCSRCVALLRVRVVVRRPGRLARGAGPRRRDDLAGHALDHHHALRRREGAQQGTRHLGRPRWWRCGCRRSRRRSAHEVRRLGMDLLRQRARWARSPSPSPPGSCAKAAPTAPTRKTSPERSR